MPDASLLPFALPAEQLPRAQLFTWASRGPCPRAVLGDGSFAGQPEQLLFCPAPRHTRQPPGAEGLLCTSRNPETTQTFLSTEKLSTESTAGSMGPLCKFQLPLSASQATTWDNCTDPLAPAHQPGADGSLWASQEAPPTHSTPSPVLGAAGNGSEHLMPLSLGAGTRQFP